MLLFGRSDHLRRHLLQQLLRSGKYDGWPDNPRILKKVIGHRIWLSASFDDRNKGYLEVRNGSIEFLRNRWPTQIYDDKVSETSQRFDCFRIIVVLWSLKIKDDRQILL